MHGVNEDRVKLWIQALRSGEFTQANGYLEKPVDKDGVKVTGNCCLGVAQHVALRNGWTPRDIAVEDVDWGASTMNEEAASWFGFSGVKLADPSLGVHETLDQDDHGYPITRSTIVHCVEANDDLGWDFDQIADALEKEYITPVSIEQES